jgi:hypothetical protein
MVVVFRHTAEAPEAAAFLWLVGELARYCWGWWDSVSGSQLNYGHGQIASALDRMRPRALSHQSSKRPACRPDMFENRLGSVSLVLLLMTRRLLIHEPISEVNTLSFTPLAGRLAAGYRPPINTGTRRAVARL